MLSEVIPMSKSDYKISCKNIFKHSNKDEIKKEITFKWINIMRALEQLPHNI